MDTRTETVERIQSRLREERVGAARGREVALVADGVQPRELVTVHFPIDAGVYAAICRAVSRRYPSARIGENGTILGIERPA